MTRAILLHIGTPKAGSTFLQRAMLRNRAHLARHGVAYPHDGTGHPGNARYIARLDAAGFEALFDGGAQTVILSHEDLFALPGEGRTLARLAAERGVMLHRLCFLRPWSEFCAGDVSQHLKQHFDRYLARRLAFDGLDFEGMAARRAREMQPAALLAGWNRLPGTPPVVIASHRGIKATVEGLLGVPDIDWAMPRHLANPSLRLTDCEAIATMMRDPGVPDSAIRQAFRDAHHRTSEPDPARTPVRMAAVEALFAPQNAALRASFGYDNRASAEAETTTG